MRIEARIGTLSPEDITTQVEHTQNPEGYLAEIQGLQTHEIAYNPAGPFDVLDQRTGEIITFLPIRVESANSDFMDPDKPYDPRIDFVERVGNNGTWKRVDPNYWDLHSTLQQLKGLEDPSVALIHGEIVLSGVRAKDPDGSIRIRTEFYAGRNLQSLEHIADVPGKDNRVCELPRSDGRGRVLVAIRPQGGIAGRGRIGFTIVDNVRELHKINRANVPFMADQVAEENWLGANELHAIPSNGHTEVGVLGHLAQRDENGMRRYSSMAFILRNADNLDQEMPQTTPVQTIARSVHLPACGAKAWDLQDVAYPGGLRRNGDGTADLYVGKNDWRFGILRIQYPFRIATA